MSIKDPYKPPSLGTWVTLSRRWEVPTGGGQVTGNGTRHATDMSPDHARRTLCTPVTQSTQTHTGSQGTCEY